MREVLADVRRWRGEGKPVAIATVIETWGSAPRAVGAKMALTPDGGISGSVSGGCVEGAVVEAGRQAIATSRPRLLSFGVTDERAWEVGLACGGKIEVFVAPLDPPIFDAQSRALDEERLAVSATVVRGPDHLLGRARVRLEGGAPAGSLDPALDVAADAATAEARTRRVETTAKTGEACELFIEAARPSPALVVVGGVHIAVALTALAKTLGFRTVVVDPRAAFGSPERFPAADRLITEWPAKALAALPLNSSTAVAVLSHDPKLDDPALAAALPSSAFYVGALGSKRTHEKRRKRLLEAGLTEDQLARLHAPIGLPLGGRAPEEIALAILAEIVTARNAAS
ncbi:MAG TPA: XdhC/CoxI family protein [Thermoanaerobaculia bacterium]